MILLASHPYNMLTNLAMTNLNIITLLPFLSSLSHTSRQNYLSSSGLHILNFSSNPIN